MLGTTRRSLCANNRASLGRRHHITTPDRRAAKPSIALTNFLFGHCQQPHQQCKRSLTRCDSTEDSFLLQSLEIRQVKEDGRVMARISSLDPATRQTPLLQPFLTPFIFLYAPQVPTMAETGKNSGHPSYHITSLPATGTTCHGHGEAILTCLTGQASALCCPLRSRILLCYQRHLLDWY
jgi:hypothetical protein